MAPFRHVLGAICFLLIKLVSGLDIVYCSNLNTADGDPNNSQYQSNGLCYQHCSANYAFAINQGYNCWCSNTAPGSTVSLGQCNAGCPGFPTDNCGGNSLFAYQALILPPSGTSGGTSTSPTSTSSPPSTTSSSTISTSSTKSSSSSSSSSSTSPTWTPSPIISLETVTGQVKTVTLTPTAPSKPNSQSLGAVSSKSGGGGGLGTGGAVGLAVGLIAAAALVSASVFFCLRKKRRAAEVRESAQQSPRGSSAGLGVQVPSRTMSEHSRYMLNSDGHHVVEAWEPDQESLRPNRRDSRMLSVDQRLNPYGDLYVQGSKSGDSINTVRDDKDYSRRVQPNGPILRMTNPD